MGSLNDYPLSRSQWRLWYQQASEPDTSTLNVTLAARLRVPVDSAAASSAIAAVLDRHEVLRSVIRIGDGAEVCQAVVDRRPPPVVLLDYPAEHLALSELSDLELSSALKPFDLEHEPPFRATVIRSPSDRALAVLATVHHVCWDAFSATILWRDLAEALASPSDTERPAQYHEYAESESRPPLRDRQASAVDRFVARAQAWDEQQADEPPAGEDRPHLLSFDLDDQLTAETAGASLFTVLVAMAARAWFATTDRDSMRLALDVSLRGELPRFDDTIGMFQNQVIVRLERAPDEELLQQAEFCVLDALECRWAPYDEVVRRSGWSGMVGRDPFDAKIFLEPPAAVADGPFEPVVRTMSFSRHDLTFGFTVRQGGTIGCCLTSRDAEIGARLPALQRELLAATRVAAGASA
ncbi:MAG: condensation domain-containing protein [Actinomycetota bacterium]|nr:condensation domain-containing protein [Actinomycetota bacterium]